VENSIYEATHVEAETSRREALKWGAALLAATTVGVAGPAAAKPLAAPSLPPLSVIALNRLAYGPKPGNASVPTSLAWFDALGVDDVERLTAYVDAQLSPSPAADTDVNNRLSAAAGNLPTLNLSRAQLWANYYLASGADRNRPVRDVRAATVIRAAYSQWQLFEVLAEFWHNHFSIFAWDSSYAGSTWVHYDRDVIRANALGNFYNLLVAVAQSPAMLYYLDNYISRDDGPNENWARELFELHAFGAENYLGVQNPNNVPDWAGVPAVPNIPAGYVDKDVYGSTSAFTGWRVNNGNTGTTANDGSFQYYDAWHWPYGPTILRETYPDFEGVAAGYRVLRRVADHPGTARFICRKLARRLLGVDPPESLVDGAATRFYNARNDSDQLKKVVRYIICGSDGPDLADSNAPFFTTWGETVKRPHEALFSAIRAVGADVRPNDGNGLSSVWGTYDAMGQQMFGRRSPDGYPDVRDPWLSSSSLLYRWRTYNSLMENSFYSTSANVGLFVDVNAVNMGGANTPNTIADFWIARLLGRPLDDPAHKAEFTRILQGWSSPTPVVTPVYGVDQVMASADINNRLRRMVAVILMSPEFQWR
jgi:uncharacterized protein (DUF1800 family)